MPRPKLEIPLPWQKFMHGSLIENPGSIFYRCVEDSYDAIMLTDAKGTVFYVNKAFETIYGYTRDEMVGQTPRRLRSKHQDNAFYSSMWSNILDPKKGYWKGELVNLSKSNEEVPVMLTISAFRGEDEAILGYMSVALDMRDRKKLEAQVFHQDRLASIGVLASGLAHEIGTPLGVVRGRAEYLMMNPDRPDKKSLEIIVSQIDRISKLIYSLLHLARTERSESTNSVSLVPILVDIQNLVEQHIRKISGQFVLDLPQTLKVNAERDRLEQVFLNLIMNAIHAMEEAKKTGRTEGHQLRVSVLDQGTEWEMLIRDTGTGIRPENLRQLFQPFFTTKPIGSGTGLGLAIASQIIQSWGGRIWAESEFGNGATFHVRLPKG